MATAAAAARATRPYFHAMRQAGATVGDLRKHKATPAEIHAAGYTLAEMKEHLGTHLLIEAFTLSELHDGGASLRSVLANGASLADALAAGYTLTDASAILTKEQLHAGGISLRDIVTSSAASFWQLRAKGFSLHELEDAGMPRPPPVMPPPPVACRILVGSLESACVAALDVGESLRLHGNDSSRPTLDVVVSRLSDGDAAALSGTPDSAWLQDPPNGSYGYEGSGKRCPACGHPFVLVAHDAGVDDMTAEERATWVCETPGCGVQKSEHYEGYGTIFYSWKELE